MPSYWSPHAVTIRQCTFVWRMGGLEPKTVFFSDQQHGNQILRSATILDRPLAKVRAFEAMLRRGLAAEHRATTVLIENAGPGMNGRVCIELTSDAMTCQRDIAEKIVDKKADYVDLKGNQGTLREDVERFATEQKSKRLSRIPPQRKEWSILYRLHPGILPNFASRLRRF
jgi:hypothetical protein